MRPTDDEYRAMFQAEYPPVFRTIRLMVGNRQTAEDVVQEAFSRLFVNWRKVSRYDRPGAWVRRVAIRIASRARTPRSAVQPDPSVPPPDPEVTDVRLALLELPTNQRAAIVLRYYEDRPVAEIAALMGCSDGTVKTHLHRARAKLAQLLGEEVPDATR